MAVVLGLLAITVKVLSRDRIPWTLWRRRPARNPALAMEVVDRLALTPQHSVHILRVGARAYLVSCQPGGTTLLAAFDWPGQPGAAA